MIFWIGAVFGLGLLILIHELGHFLAARAGGIRVRTFSIGFGPKLLRIRKGETDYALSVIPFGGYVHMAGETDETEPGGFLSRPPWIRLGVVLAGPLANLLLGFLLYWGAYSLVGLSELPGNTVGKVAPASWAAEAGLQPGDQIIAVNGEPFQGWSAFMEFFLHATREDSILAVTVLRGRDTLTLQAPVTGISDLGIQPALPPVIARVVKGKPAEVAGLQAGDRILAVNGHPVRWWHEMGDYVIASPGIPLELLVLRGEDTLTVTVVPEPMPDDPTKGFLGVVAPTRTRRLSLFEGAAKAWDRSVRAAGQVVGGLVKLFRREVSTRELGGPVLIGKVIGESAEVGAFPFLSLLALISINLGLLNLLPLPVLDGGHVVFLLLEILARRRLPLRIQAAIHTVGLAALLLLMLYLTVQDIGRILSGG